MATQWKSAQSLADLRRLYTSWCRLPCAHLPLAAEQVIERHLATFTEWVTFILKAGPHPAPKPEPYS